jgi:hypothetical protein
VSESDVLSPVTIHHILSPLGIKGGAKSRPGAHEDDAESIDSMAMEVNEPDSEFESESAHPRLPKKGATSKGKKAAEPTVAKKKVSRRKDAVSMAAPDIPYQTYEDQE